MRTVLTTLMTALIVAGGGFVLICALLYFSQERSIFYPRPNDAQLRERYAAQRVEIETADAKLEGWWIENAQEKTPAVILYFGGNAEDRVADRRARDRGRQLSRLRRHARQAWTESAIRRRPRHL